MAAKSVVITDFATQLPGKVDPLDPTVYIFPQITSVNQNVVKTFWRIIVRIVENAGTPKERFLPITPEWFNPKHAPENAAGWIKVISKTGEDGKIRDVVPDVISAGKYKGKSNATSPFTQALRDALSKHNLQKKKTLDAAGADGLEMLPPMLAQKREDDIDFSDVVYAQTKYNGVRAVVMRVWVETVPANINPDDPTANTEPRVVYHAGPVPNTVKRIVMYSRRRGIYPEFDEIKTEADAIFDFHDEFVKQHPEFKGRLFLDGEIYKHGEKLQDIAGTARNTNKAIDLKYYIYDLFIAENTALKYAQRKVLFDAIAARFPATKHIVFAPTVQVHNNAEVKALYARFKAEGYEGAMIRLNRPYTYSFNDYHCNSLLKMKALDDGEFKVVGFTSGTHGKNAGTLLMICEAANGKQFNVSLKDFTLPDSKAKFKEMSRVEENGKTVFENKYKSRMMTVYYEELSKDGVPLRANTELYIREDL